MVKVVDSSCLSQLKVQMNFLTELVFSKKQKQNNNNYWWIPLYIVILFINTIKLFMDYKVKNM